MTSALARRRPTHAAPLYAMRGRRPQWAGPATTRSALAVAALFAVAMSGYAIVHPNGFVSESIAGSGHFRLCAERRQPNCVVDGDTIRYRGVKIRLADLDTPEVFSPKCAFEASLGRQATYRLMELINAGPFEMVRVGSRDEDRYGRKLRVIERNGRSLSDTLIAEGLARPWEGARRSWCG